MLLMSVIFLTLTYYINNKCLYIVVLRLIFLIYFLPYYGLPFGFNFYEKHYFKENNIKCCHSYASKL